MARAKSAAAKKAALAGQGNLFGDPVAPLPGPVPAAELQEEAEAMQLATAQTTPHEYTLVPNAARLREVVAEVARYEEFCFDTETTGFDIFNDRIVGLSLAVEPHRAWYVPFREEDAAEYAGIVRPLFEEERIAKIGQNVKFDLMVLRRLGIEVRGRKYDTMILHYLLDPESRHNMNALSEKYLNYRPIEIETLIGKGQKQLTMDLVNVERVKEYAAEDADITLQLKRVLYPMVERIGLERLYSEIEEPMIEVLASIEMAGVRIDTAALAEYAVELNRRMAELEAAIRAEAGEPSLNINSTRQLWRGALREDADRRETQDDAYQTVLHRRGVPPDLRPQAPHRGPRAGVPRREETPFDLCGGASAVGEPHDGAHPHLVQPGGDGHRASLVHESQPAEHPRARGDGPPHPPGVHSLGRRPPAALGRLQPGRACG